MGRTLDSLKHGDAQRDPHRDPHRATKTASTSDSKTPEDCVVDWTMQEEVPFIEVGAPGKGVEMSPHLVKHAPQPRISPPHAPLGKAIKTTPVVHLTETRPMSVAFESWPRPGAGAVAPELIAHHQPQHAIAREYAALLAKMVPGQTPHVVMLCGLHPHSGTSTVLLNLAVVAAQQNRRVAALDLNLEHPAIASRLGLADASGLRDLLAGSLAAGQALRATAIANLHVLPAGAPGKSPLTADALGWLLRWLRERYDLILIDGPCAAEPTDLAVPAPDADGIYLVLPDSETSGVPRGIAAAIARMGGRLCGLIHTHFEG